MVIVLGLVGSCSSGATENRDDSQPVTDAEVLAEDPRFDGEPVTKGAVAEVCEKIATTLNDTGEFSVEVGATFRAEDDMPCRLSDVLIGDEQTSASAELSFYRLKKKELAQAADLLRDDKAHIVDCVMYRGMPPAGFGLSTIALDSGPLCDTPPDMGIETSFAMGGFVANRTLVSVKVSTSRAKSDSDRFTVLGDPIPARDLIVAATRDVLESHPKKIKLPEQLPDITEIQELCTTVLEDTVKSVSSVEPDSPVVNVWPSEQSSKSVWCRTSGSAGANGSEVWNWVSITPDIGSSDLEKFYDGANPKFYDRNEGYTCQLLQNLETFAALEPSSIGEGKTYPGCQSTSTTGSNPASYEERVVFIDDGLVVQAGSFGVKRNDAGEVIGSASEVINVTHEVQNALVKTLADGYTKLRA